MHDPIDPLSIRPATYNTNMFASKEARCQRIIQPPGHFILPSGVAANSQSLPHIIICFVVQIVLQNFHTLQTQTKFNTICRRFYFHRTSNLSNSNRWVPLPAYIKCVLFHCHDSWQSIHAIHLSGQWMPSESSSTCAEQPAEVEASRRESDIETRSGHSQHYQGPSRRDGWQGQA